MKSKKNGPELRQTYLREFVREHLKIYIEPLTKRIESIALTYGLGLTELDKAAQSTMINNLMKNAVAEMALREKVLHEFVLNNPENKADYRVQLLSKKLVTTLQTPFRIVVLKKTEPTDNDYIGLTEKDSAHGLLLVNCFKKLDMKEDAFELEPPRFEDFMRKHLNIYINREEAYIDYVSLSQRPHEIKEPAIDPAMLAVVVRLQTAFRMMRAVRKMKEDMKGVVCRFFKRQDDGHNALITVYKTNVKVTRKTTTTETKTETRNVVPKTDD